MIRQMIKNIIGQRNWSNLLAIFKYAKSNIYFLKKKVKLMSAEGWKMDIYSVPGAHTFFGYYDISQMNVEENKLLALVVDKRAYTRTDSAKIGFFDVESQKFQEVTKTRAWCWQQGARLRWHPLNQEQIVVNALKEDNYVTQIWDINEKRCVGEICTALYDLDSQFTYGLSLNFTRLQRLRPGYGYDSLLDLTKDDHAPQDDGIFYVNLLFNYKKLIISLRDLAIIVDPDLEYEHFINHISISPDGKRFMFFHIWNVSEGTGWRTRLYIYEIAHQTLTLLEDTDKVSHYDWRGNNEIIVTCYKADKTQYYALYHVDNETKNVISVEGLEKDGHPSFCANETTFITDTYPLAYSVQHLYQYDLNAKKRTEIATAYSSPLMHGEKRCDLHPRLSKSEQYITFDSSFSQNVRKIVMLTKEGT